MSEFTVDVNVSLNIEEETAKKALTLLEWYCQHNDKVIVPYMDSHRKISLRFVDHPVLDTCPCCGYDIPKK